MQSIQLALIFEKGQHSDEWKTQREKKANVQIMLSMAKCKSTRNAKQSSVIRWEAVNDVFVTVHKDASRCTSVIVPWIYRRRQLIVVVLQCQCLARLRSLFTAAVVNDRAPLAVALRRWQTTSPDTRLYNRLSRELTLAICRSLCSDMSTLRDLLDGQQWRTTSTVFLEFTSSTSRRCRTTWPSSRQNAAVAVASAMTTRLRQPLNPTTSIVTSSSTTSCRAPARWEAVTVAAAKRRVSSTWTNSRRSSLTLTPRLLLWQPHQQLQLQPVVVSQLSGWLIIDHSQLLSSRLVYWVIP